MTKHTVVLGFLLSVLMVWASPLAITGLSGGALSGGTASAAEEKKETRKVPAMREKTYKVLAEAQLLIDPESVQVEEGEEKPAIAADPRKAIEILTDLQDKRGVNSYELAQIFNTMAFAYYTLEDIPNTLAMYENVLKQEITEALELTTLRALFQLYYSQEDYKKSLVYMDRWEALKGEPDAGVTFIRATAYYQLEDFKNALKAALRTEEIALAQGKEVKENWWYLQVVIYNELKDTDNVIKVLEKLVVTFPKKQYWMHLAGMYAEKDQDNKALSAYYAAYTQGMLEKETEIVMLSQRLLNAEVPYEAAMILEKGIKDKIVKESDKNLKLLATAYTMAVEYSKAIDAWRDAASHSDDGQLDYRLAQALANQDRHKEAIEAYKRALEKGVDDDDEADANFWLGISLMQVESWDQATAAFRLAAKDKKMEKSARQYIKYVDSEKNRQEQLKAMLEG